MWRAGGGSRPKSARPKRRAHRTAEKAAGIAAQQDGTGIGEAGKAGGEVDNGPESEKTGGDGNGVKPNAKPQ